MSRIAECVFDAIRLRGQISTLEATQLAGCDRKRLASVMAHYIGSGIVRSEVREVTREGLRVKARHYWFPEDRPVPESPSADPVRATTKHAPRPREFGVPALWAAWCMGSLPSKPLPGTVTTRWLDTPEDEREDD